MAELKAWLRGLFGSPVEPVVAGSVAPVYTRPSRPLSFAEANNEFALAMYGRLGRPTGEPLLLTIQHSHGLLHGGGRSPGRYGGANANGPLPLGRG
jgi:hypothetical protein